MNFSEFFILFIHHAVTNYQILEYRLASVLSLLSASARK